MSLRPIEKQNVYLHLIHFRFSNLGSKAIAGRHTASAFLEWRTIQNARFDFTGDLHERIAPKREYGSTLGCLKLANLVTATRSDASKYHF